jgi:type I restriction enzyme, S subunit
MSWRLTKLSEILMPVSRPEAVDPTREYRLLGIRLDGKGAFLRETKLGSQSAASSLFQVKSGDFIYSRLFAWRGAFAVIGAGLDDCYVSNEFPTFTINPGTVDIEFLRLWFRLPTTLATVEANCFGTTSLTRNRFKEHFFLALEIALPSIEEQCRIVARIDELAGKIEEARGFRREAVEEAESITTAAARQLFPKKGAYQEVALEKVCAVIIDNLHSNPVYADNGIPCVRSSDVGWGTLNLDTARKTSEEEYVRRTVRGEPTTDDIVLVREGGGTGKAAIVLKGQRFSLGQRVMMLRPNQNLIMPRFFLHQILSPHVYEDQILPLCKGSASPHLNIGALRKFTFLLPPLEEQRRIVAYLDHLQAKVDALKQLQAETATELDALLPAVLDRAFKGEL